MSDEIKMLVDRRCADYGIGAEPQETNGAQKRSLRQMLRR
jgi:hypothetical protein